MKTKISTTILLVLSIQVMVSGQTQGNQAGLKAVKTSNKTSLKDSVKKNQPSSSHTKKILTTLDRPAVKTPQAGESNSAANSTPTNSNKTATVLSPTAITDLLDFSENLNKQAQHLRQEAKTKPAAERNKLLNEARELDQQAFLKQLEASEISGKLSVRQFNSNKITISIMIGNYTGEKSTLVYTYELIVDSEKDMKLAKEMREEAYSQATLAAKVGNLSNAEEKETLALSKQKQVISLLSRNTVIAGNMK